MMKQCSGSMMQGHMTLWYDDDDLLKGSVGRCFLLRAKIPNVSIDLFSLFIVMDCDIISYIGFLFDNFFDVISRVNCDFFRCSMHCQCNSLKHEKSVLVWHDDDDDDDADIFILIIHYLIRIGVNFAKERGVLLWKNEHGGYIITIATVPVYIV